MRDDIISIDLVQRQLQKFVLVFPVSLSLCVVFPFIGTRWRVCDFGDQEGGRGLCNAVDENTEQRNLQENEEAYAEAEQNTLAISEPRLLLRWRVSDSLEIGIQLRMVSG